MSSTFLNRLNSNSTHHMFSKMLFVLLLTQQRWNRSGFSRPDPTGKFQNHRRLTGFFIEGFCSLFNVSNKKFSKGGKGMGEVVKFVTLDGGLREKTQKNFCFFLQK